MSERKWTKEQMQAIKLNGANILVSAAAGSGKTSVLVERIINKIINEKVDIDKILVATFTNAAASEMRQRLMDAIYKKLEENPNDQNLQKQLLLINKAHISTIHSFCLSVIKNNFFEIGISNNFRIADTTEIKIMQEEILEEIFETKYEQKDNDFLELLEKYTTYKDEDNLKNLIMSIYFFIQSNPYSEKWLEHSIEEYNIKETDFGQTKWGRILVNEIKKDIAEGIEKLEKTILKLSIYPNLEDCIKILEKDLVNLKLVKIDTWDNIYNGLTKINFDDWSRKRKMSEEEKEVKVQSKATRDLIIENIKNIKNIVITDSSETIKNIQQMYPVLKIFQKLVLEFSEEFKKRKKEKNILDFNDFEHMTLKILVDENGKPTEIAKKYNFEEIEIDEYQDSNSVQECIMKSISNGKNMFMVGDVKQSIYKFRQSNPNLFMDKYDKYNLPEEEIKKDTKILLYKNFRSRENVLDVTNLIFNNIMSKELGEIEYTKEEALNLGASFVEPKIDCIAELNIIDVDKESDSEEGQELVENNVLEARLIAKKIKELHEKNVPYKDMAILLRSLKNIANIFEKELIEEGIPVFSDANSEYLNTIEIETIMSLLKIIDNPLQDIPLVTVLRSIIGGFTDNDLIEIRLTDKKALFYVALKQSLKSEEISDKLKVKIERFLNLIDKFKQKEKELPLDELIWYIYNETGYYQYVSLMVNGKLRQANLKKLFEKAKEYEKISFKGLFNFIHFIEKVSVGSNDLGAAKIIGENDDVVRIMSIHKSKGLEFPIVFIGNLNKRFKYDNNTIMLDEELGIGIDYNNNGIKYPIIPKQVIKNKMTKEVQSEEMRLLYVALTRAKEKIIMVATRKNPKEVLEKKGEILNNYYKFEKPEKLNYKIIEKYSNYIDWIELVYKYNIDSKMKLNIIEKNELLKHNLEEENEILSKKQKLINEINNKQIDKEKYNIIDKSLNYKYKYLNDIELITKTSVTALKQEKIINKKIPKFEQENKITSTRKGTIIHLILSKISKERNIEEIEKLIDNLVQKNIITKEEKEKIDINIIKNYLQSELYAQLLNAKEVKREIPFFVNIDANKIYNDTNEKILVQGVIDLYYISNDDKLILVDYKTDFIKENEKELIEKYNKQLELYKLALEKSLKRKVDKKYIYSTYLNKIIEI